MAEGILPVVALRAAQIQYTVTRIFSFSAAYVHLRPN